MNKECREAFYKMYRACLNATGAYEALKTAGLVKFFPGYKSCVKDLNKAIKLAKKVMENEL